MAVVLDHDNLDPNRPVQMQDAYAIATGEIGLKSGVRFNDRRRGKSGLLFQPQITYGAFENAQIEIQCDLFTEPASVPRPSKSGDLHLGMLYNFNTETLVWPALAARVEADLPTGVHSRGIHTQMTGILTRSLRRLRAHINAGYTVLGQAQGMKRNGIYRVGGTQPSPRISLPISGDPYRGCIHSSIGPGRATE